MKLSKKQRVILVIITVIAICFAAVMLISEAWSNRKSGISYGKEGSDVSLLTETELPEVENLSDEDGEHGIRKGIPAWTEEINKYSLVLAEYQAAEMHGFEDIKFTYPDVSLSLSKMSYEVMDLYFVFEDLAEDGEPELIIAAGYAGRRTEPIEGYHIVDIFGFNGTKPQKLFEDDFMGSTSQYYLCDKGRIKKISAQKDAKAEIYVVKANHIQAEKETESNEEKYPEQKLVRWRRLQELEGLSYEEGDMLDDKLIYNEKDAEEYLQEYLSDLGDVTVKYKEMDKYGYKLEYHWNLGVSIVGYYSVDEKGQIYSHETGTYEVTK